MENARYSVTINPTFWDLFAASLTLIRYQGARIILHAIFPLAGLFILVFSIYVKRRVGPVDVLIIILSFFFTPILIASAVWKARRNKLAQGPFTCSFDSEGVHTSGATFAQTIKWPAVLRARQSKRFLFLFIAPSNAIFIPLKALIDQGVLNEIPDIIGRHTDLR